MIAQGRYLLLTATRTRTPLAPLAITFFAVIGTFFYGHNEVGATWGQTGVMCCALTAWLVGAVLAGEPAPQAEMASAAAGGRGRLEALLVVMAAPVLAFAFIAYPLALYALGYVNIFEPAARLGDVAGAALVHLCCGVLGGAVAVLFAPPRVTRRATASAAVLAALLVFAGLGSLFGPVAAAQAISDAKPGMVNGDELLACLSCLALAAAAFGAAALWSRRV